MDVNHHRKLYDTLFDSIKFMDKFENNFCAINKVSQFDLKPLALLNEQEHSQYEKVYEITWEEHGTDLSRLSSIKSHGAKMTGLFDYNSPYKIPVAFMLLAGCRPNEILHIMNADNETKDVIFTKCPDPDSS